MSKPVSKGRKPYTIEEIVRVAASAGSELSAIIPLGKGTYAARLSVRNNMY